MKFRKSICVLGIVLSMVFECETVLAAEVTVPSAEVVTEQVAVPSTEVVTEQAAVPSTEVVTEQAVVPSEENAQAIAILANEIQAVTDPEMHSILYTQLEVLTMGLSLEKYHNIHVLGDSITEGVGASNESKTYPSVLSRLTGAKVNNYGVSGSRITDAKTDIPHPAAFVNRMYSMSPEADLIIVFGGTNDFWFGDCPIGIPTDRGRDTFYGALNNMMSYLKISYPNADIVFITPYQQSKDATETQPYKRSTYGNYGTGTLKEYRIAMLDRCQYYGIPVLDLYADYELNTVDNIEALRKYGQYLCDGCHLNDAGYNLLARKIYKFVMQDLDSYMPEYVTVNNMVFETAALPALVQNGQLVMPNGQCIAAKNGVILTPDMGTRVLYNYLIEALYY